MLGSTLESVRNAPGICICNKDLINFHTKCTCGSPATGRALVHKDRTRPAFNNFLPRQRAIAFAWLPGPLKQAMSQGSECTPMFNSKHIGREKGSGNILPKTPFIAWTIRMSVGVKLLDNDHKKMAILINELHDGIWAGLAKPELESLFESLISDIRIHFNHEERLFAETGYPDAAIHALEHQHLMERVLDLQDRFKNDTELDSYLEVVNLLKGWLFSHVEISDQEYVPHLKASAVNAILAARQFHVGSTQRSPIIRPRVVQGAV